MLPARNRMRSGADFGVAIRSGGRAGGRHVVAHLSMGSTSADPALVGLVVSKAVGNAVQRNLVKRRLRDALRAEIGQLPDGARVVVRALPGAASTPYVQLREDLHGALGRARRRADEKAAGHAPSDRRRR